MLRVAKSRMQQRKAAAAANAREQAFTADPQRGHQKPPLYGQPQKFEPMGQEVGAFLNVDDARAYGVARAVRLLQKGGDEIFVSDPRNGDKIALAKNPEAWQAVRNGLGTFVARALVDDEIEAANREQNDAYRLWQLGRDAQLNDPVVTPWGDESLGKRFPEVERAGNHAIELQTMFRAWAMRLHNVGPQTEKEKEYYFRYLVWPIKQWIQRHNRMDKGTREKLYKEEIDKALLAGYNPSRDREEPLDTAAPMDYLRCRAFNRKTPPCLDAGINPWMTQFSRKYDGSPLWGLGTNEPLPEEVGDMIRYIGAPWTNRFNIRANYERGSADPHYTPTAASRGPHQYPGDDPFEVQQLNDNGRKRPTINDPMESDRDGGGKDDGGDSPSDDPPGPPASGDPPPADDPMPSDDDEEFHTPRGTPPPASKAKPKLPPKSKQAPPSAAPPKPKPDVPPKPPPSNDADLLANDSEMPDAPPAPLPPDLPEQFDQLDDEDAPPPQAPPAPAPRELVPVAAAPAPRAAPPQARAATPPPPPPPTPPAARGRPPPPAPSPAPAPAPPANSLGLDPTAYPPRQKLTGKQRLQKQRAGDAAAEPYAPDEALDKRQAKHVAQTKAAKEAKVKQRREAATKAAKRENAIRANKPVPQPATLRTALKSRYHQLRADEKDKAKMAERKAIAALLKEKSDADADVDDDDDAADNDVPRAPPRPPTPGTPPSERMDPQSEATGTKRPAAGRFSADSTSASVPSRRPAEYYRGRLTAARNMAKNIADGSATEAEFREMWGMYHQWDDRVQRKRKKSGSGAPTVGATLAEKEFWTFISEWGKSRL